MQIGDIVWREEFGIGKIVDIRISPALYLIYFYKENKMLHDGFGRGSDCHYYWCFKSTLTFISISLYGLIERRRSAQDKNR